MCIPILHTSHDIQNLINSKGRKTRHAADSKFVMEDSTTGCSSLHNHMLIGSEYLEESFCLQRFKEVRDITWIHLCCTTRCIPLFPWCDTSCSVIGEQMHVRSISDICKISYLSRAKQSKNNSETFNPVLQHFLRL